MVNPLLEQVYSSGKVIDAEGNQYDLAPISIPRETAVVLEEFVFRHALKRTLEVGFAYGLSALAICEAHKRRGEGSHIAIDPLEDADYHSIGLLNLHRAGRSEFVRFLSAPSHEALPQLLKAGERLDFAFIDGMHLFDNVLLDFYYVDRMLEPSGYIAFDDLWMKSIRRVISFVLSNRSYELEPVSSAGRPWWRRTARAVRRFLADPLERTHPNVRFGAGNICFLRKTGKDSRRADFYRAF